MTRINLVDPALLSRQHLLAETRELPRIFGLVKKAIARGEHVSDYKFDGYRLGKDHCKQFYSRLQWLQNRQKALVDECMRRGYKVQYTQTESLTEGIPSEWRNDWTPTERDVKLNVNRINERGGNIGG